MIKIKPQVRPIREPREVFFAACFGVIIFGDRSLFPQGAALLVRSRWADSVLKSVQIPNRIEPNP